MIAKPSNYFNSFQTTEVPIKKKGQVG